MVTIIYFLLFYGNNYDIKDKIPKLGPAILKKIYYGLRKKKSYIRRAFRDP